MAGSLNRVQLLGNVGKDPEVRTLNNGGKVATFSVATSETWKDKASGEKKEKTSWHNVVCWNEGLVGVVERYLKKGSKVFVEGALETREWEKDGIKRYATEVVLKAFNGQLILLGDAKADGGSTVASGSGGYGSARSGGAGAGRLDPDDEIPF